MFIQAVLLCTVATAGWEKTAQPTSVFASAGSGVAGSSIDHVWLNPASAASISSFTATLFYYPSLFQLPQLTQYGLMVAQPFSEVTVSVGLATIGFPLYRETTGSLTLSRPMTEEFSAGVTLHGYHLAIDRYGSTTLFSSDIGGIISVTETLLFGISLGNINGADIGDDEEIPRTISMGVTFRPIDQVTCMVDIVKDMRYSETVKAGMQFSPVRPLTLYIGMQGEQSRLFGGMCITISSMSVQYGIGTHDDLGATHSIGITITP